MHVSPASTQLSLKNVIFSPPRQTRLTDSLSFGLSSLVMFHRLVWSVLLQACCHGNGSFVLHGFTLVLALADYICELIPWLPLKPEKYMDAFFERRKY